MREHLAQLNDKLNFLESVVNRPLVSPKQMLVAVTAVLSVVFAAGGWAASTHISIVSIERTLVNMHADLKQLGDVSILRIRVETLSQEVDRLREYQERK